MSRFTHVFKHSKLVFFCFLFCIFFRIFLICKLKVSFLNNTAIASPSIYLIYPIYSTKFYTFSCSVRCFLYSSKFSLRSFICSIPIIWFPLEKMKFYKYRSLALQVLQAARWFYNNFGYRSPLQMHQFGQQLSYCSQCLSAILHIHLFFLFFLIDQKILQYPYSC